MKDSCTVQRIVFRPRTGAACNRANRAYLPVQGRAPHADVKMGESKSQEAMELSWVHVSKGVPGG